MTAPSVRTEPLATGTRLVVETGAPDDTAALELLLTDTVFEVVRYLGEVQDSGAEVAIVDVRLPDALPDAAAPGALGFVEAARGLVQSFVLETPASAPVANVVISGSGQEAARERTVQYLASADGRFSRGASYDLREVAR